MKNPVKGFTLLEVVIYMAIIGLIISTFVTFILVISLLRNKFYVISEIRANERVMQEIFYHYLRNAQEIIIPIKQSNEAHLDFIPGDSLLVYSFFEKDGKLLLSDGFTSTPVTTNEVLVSGLNFTNLSSPGTADVLQIKGTIRGYASTSIDYVYENDFKYNFSLPK